MTTEKIALLPHQRSCGHIEKVISYVGDLSQQAYLAATACSNCREATLPKFCRGRGSSR